MKKWIGILIVVLVVIFGLFWAWSHYSMHRSTSIGTAINSAPAPTQNAAQAGANY